MVSVTDTIGIALRSTLREGIERPAACSIFTTGRDGYRGLILMTIPSSPLLNRTFVPKGYTDNCSTSAFMTSRGNAVRSLTKSSLTASCGRRRRRYGRGLIRASKMSTAPIICASSLICRPLSLFGYPCPIPRSCACKTTSANHP